MDLKSDHQHTQNVSYVSGFHCTKQPEIHQKRVTFFPQNKTTYTSPHISPVQEDHRNPKSQPVNTENDFNCFFAYRN